MIITIGNFEANIKRFSVTITATDNSAEDYANRLEVETLGDIGSLEEATISVKDELKNNNIVITNETSTYTYTDYTLVEIRQDVDVDLNHIYLIFKK